MERHLEEAKAAETEQTGTSSACEIGPEVEYRQDSRSIQAAMRDLRQVQKTRWLLGNILDGTFTDPVRLSEPPQRGWAGEWEDLFDGATLEELRERFGYSKGEETQEEPSASEDDVDPFKLR